MILMNLSSLKCSVTVSRVAYLGGLLYLAIDLILQNMNASLKVIPPHGVLPSEARLVATINCAKNISKRRRSRNTTNGLVILQTLMSPHWTVWEAIIHSFFFQASFSVLGLPKYTKKIHRNSCLQFLSHFASFFFLFFLLSRWSNQILFGLDI